MNVIHRAGQPYGWFRLGVIGAYFGLAIGVLTAYIAVRFTDAGFEALNLIGLGVVVGAIGLPLIASWRRRR